MKSNLIIAILLISGAIYYWTDGGTTLGLTPQQALPDTLAPPNSTFLGDEVVNPYVSN